MSFCFCVFKIDANASYIQVTACPLSTGPLHFRNTYCILWWATQFYMGLLYTTDDVPARKAITFCTESNCQLWELHFSMSKAFQNYHFSSATLDFSLQTYHFPTITHVALNLAFTIPLNCTIKFNPHILESIHGCSLFFMTNRKLSCSWLKFISGIRLLFCSFTTPSHHHLWPHHSFPLSLSCPQSIIFPQYRVISSS